MKSFTQEARRELTINGRPVMLMVHPSDTLLHTLRRNAGLTGTKLGCENGDCGACTVQIDGVPTKSCLTLTVDVLDRQITTVEGLHETPIQDAFVRESGFQCGFCTPGFLMNASALLEKHSRPGDQDIREWMESNICRCTGYEGIERAIKSVRDRDSDQ